jgi:glycosyltransferase involved in cell wall biosynthesis
MTPTIAFVAGHLSGGGAERQLLYLLCALKEFPVRLRLATLTPTFPGVDRIEALGIPVERIPASGWKLDRLVRLTLWLRRERPVLVHSWVPYGNVYAAWAGALAGVPVRLGSVRGDAFYGFKQGLNASTMLLRLGLQAPDAVVVNSGAAAAALAERGPRRARLVVVRNGMDIEALVAAAGSAQEKNRHPDGSAGGGVGPVLAMVGRLVPLKNVPMFFRVIASLADRYPTLQGWIIGDGPEHARLQMLAREMGVASRVRFWGERPDVPALLAGADIFCHCSQTEGLSNAIMEASALGLPIVATRAGGAAEIIENGVTGLLVEPDDSASMAHYVDLLVRDPDQRARLGEAGRRKMAEEFSLARMVRDMVGCYREVLAEKRRDDVPWSIT